MLYAFLRLRTGLCSRSEELGFCFGAFDSSAVFKRLVNNTRLAGGFITFVFGGNSLSVLATVAMNVCNQLVCSEDTDLIERLHAVPLVL